MPDIRMPGCLYLTKKNDKIAGFQKEFSLGGLRIEFCSSLPGLIEKLQDASNFLVFIELADFPETLQWLSSLGPAHERKFYWIGVGNIAQSSHSAILFKMGASDVIAPPVHPSLARARAHMLIQRYLSRSSFPPDVVLPNGISNKGPAKRIHNLDDPSQALSFTVPDPSPRPHIDRVDDTRFTVTAPPLWSPKKLHIWNEAQKVFAQKTRRFSEIADVKTQRSLLALSSLQKSSVILWSPQGKLKIETTVDRFFENQSDLVLAPTGFERQLADSKNAVQFCQIKLGLTALFLYSRPQHHNESLRLKLPTKLYETQRRGAYRMPLIAQSGPECRIVDRLGRLCISRIFDISATGIKVTLADQDFTQLGNFSMVKIEFVFEDRKISTAAQVRWKRSKKGEYSLGLSFKDLSAPLRNEIGLRAYDHYSPGLEKVFG